MICVQDVATWHCASATDGGEWCNTYACHPPPPTPPPPVKRHEERIGARLALLFFSDGGRLDVWTNKYPLWIYTCSWGIYVVDAYLFLLNARACLVFFSFFPFLLEFPFKSIIHFTIEEHFRVSNFEGFASCSPVGSVTWPLFHFVNSTSSSTYTDTHTQKRGFFFFLQK